MRTAAGRALHFFPFFKSHFFQPFGGAVPTQRTPHCASCFFVKPPFFVRPLSISPSVILFMLRSLLSDLERTTPGDPTPNSRRQHRQPPGGFRIPLTPGTLRLTW